MPTMGDGTSAEGTMPTMGDGTEAETAEDIDLEAIDTEMMVDTATVSAPMAVLQFVKSHWVILAAVFAVLDLACIVVLVVLTRKEKKRRLAEAKAAAEAAALAGEVVRPIRKSAKKHRQNSVMPLVVVLVGMLLLVVVVEGVSRYGTTSSVSTTEASILSGEAEVTTLSTTLPGAGTLTEEDSQDMTVPEGVSISKWYVSNGDTVEEGDVLAAVDQVSVLSTVESLQTLLDALDEELAEHEEDAVDEDFTAIASGRVKVIYAEEDVSVLDTVYQYGALMLISLDGTMAVTIQTDTELSAGDAVVVTLSDGTQEDGKVESYLKGTAVITLTDEGTTLDDAVTVSDADGTVLGTGTLYIHSELKVTAVTGTVGSIEVEIDEEIEAGDTLLTLTDTDYTGDYLTILAQREALEAQIDTLFQLYLDGYLYATCSGVVSGIDEDSVTNTASLMEGVITFLTGGTDAAEDYLDFLCMVTQVNAEEGTLVLLVSAEPVEIEDYTDLESLDLSDEALAELLTSVVEIEISESVLVYTNTEEGWISGSMSQLQEGDILLLTCNRTSEEDVPLWMIYVSGTDQAAADGENPDEQTGTDQSTASAQEGQTEADAQTQSGSTTSGMESVTGMTGTTGTTGSTSSATAESGLSGESDLTEDTSTSTSYGVSETTVVSITPQDSMVITITIDELDILSLAVGQTAQVTLDALPGQSFEGTVTAINTSGSNSGGSSKFSVDVTIDRNSSMLVGMNASVKIILSTTEDVLTIPVAALVEEDSIVYVYTSYDEKTETLGDPVEVTTGLSDGESVEITSGLTEGDEYWYSYLDTVNYSVAVVSSGTSAFSFSFGGGSMSGGF